MALISCPHCGKQITDRMEKCIHCGAVLIEKTVQPTVTKEEVKASAKGSFIGVAIALLLTILLVLSVSFVSTIYAGHFMGNTALAAVGCAKAIFLSKNLGLLLLGGVLFCCLPAFFNKQTSAQFAIGIVITLLYCMVGFAIQSIAIRKFNVPPDILPYIRSLSLGFGFAFPMVLGSLSIASFHRPVRKALLLQIILAVAFLILCVIFDVLMLVVFHMGCQGISFAHGLSAVAVFAASLLTSKGFQNLIAPKK